MTPHFHLETTESREDADMAVLTDYLGGFMTKPERDAFEDRLAFDVAFAARVGPIIEIWYSIGEVPPTAEYNAQMRSRSWRLAIGRPRTAALWLGMAAAAAAIVWTILSISPSGSSPSESALKRPSPDRVAVRGINPTAPRKTGAPASGSTPKHTAPSVPNSASQTAVAVAAPTPDQKEMSKTPVSSVLPSLGTAADSLPSAAVTALLRATLPSPEITPVARPRLKLDVTDVKSPFVKRGPSPSLAPSKKLEQRRKGGDKTSAPPGLKVPLKPVRPPIIDKIGRE